MKTLKLVFLLLVLPLVTFPQDTLVTCGFTDVLLTDSSYAGEVDRLNKAIYNGAIQKTDELITIPVVFHIIHKGEPIGTGTNISDAQIYSAINSTNEHLRKSLNTPGDGNGADFNVELCLANIGPNGLPTTGINRVNGCVVADYCEEGISSGGSLGASEMTIKNLSRWNNQEYYNIWIVSEIGGNNGGGGVQGYAYFPTTSGVDGIVQLFNATGTEGNLKSYTNQNKTLTHEFGHAFALFHTWGGGPQPGFAGCDESNCAFQQDRVCDTEPSTGIEACNSPANSCPGVGNSVAENYMSYAQESCKSKFTQGQVDRGRQALAFSRANLITSNKCTGARPLVDVEVEVIAPHNMIICPGESLVGIRIQNTGEELLHYADLSCTVNGVPTNLTYNFPIGPGQDDEIYFTTFDFESGPNTIDIAISSVNGNTVDILVEREFDVSNNTPVDMEFQVDALAGQNSWNLSDPDGNVLISSPSYPNFSAGDVYIEEFCLPDGCYVFTLEDTGGNGFSNGSGLLTLTSEDDSFIDFEATGNFGASAIYEFCIGEINPLPVELINFEAYCENESVTIEWSTASESNSDYFSLYRLNPETNSDLDWENVIVIDAAGYSNSTIDYSVYDQSPYSHTYYKLVQYDFDGDFTEYDKIETFCEVKIDCDLVVNGNQVISLSGEQVYIVNIYGIPQLNNSLAPGFYIAYTKNCKVKILITNK